MKNSTHPLGNRDLIRALNRSTILNMINSDGPIARAEIARRSGLSPATVTAITAELIEENLVFEKESGDSSGGRPPILLALNPQGGYVIGIKLMEDHATGALTDLEATVLSKDSQNLSGRDPSSVTKDLAELINRLRSTVNLKKSQFLGVGVGLAGIVDAERGIVRKNPFFVWEDVPLQESLQKLVRVPVYIDNDVNTLALTEKWFGAGQDIRDFLIITVGRGTGLGLVINGQVLRGMRGGAGEYGHTVIDPDGPRCECGKRGCLESYVGDHGLIRAAQEAWKVGEISRKVETTRELLELAKGGDPGAIKIYAIAGEILGRGTANLINILAPQLIIVSGEGAIAGDYLFRPMCEALNRYVMPGLSDATEIQFDSWGDDAWARGAASLVLGELFESPVNKKTSRAEKLV